MRVRDRAGCVGRDRPPLLKRPTHPMPWRWDQAAASAYREAVEHGGRIADAMRAFRTLLGDSNFTQLPEDPKGILLSTYVHIFDRDLRSANHGMSKVQACQP